MMTLGVPATALRILFAGGCHVDGYPLVAQDAFSRVAVERLERRRSCDTRYIAHVSLSKASIVVGECQRLHPDVLVLQLGHYESGIWVSKRLRKLFGRGKSRKISSESSTESESISVTSPRQPMSLLRSILRSTADRLLTLAGSPAYPLSAFESDLDCFLKQVHAVSIPFVFLLSPFPCPDPPVRKRRRAMYSSFAEFSRKYGFCYLDVTGDLDPATWKTNPSLYADAFHLGCEGHKRVGLRLAEAMCERLAL